MLSQKRLVVPGLNPKIISLLNLPQVKKDSAIFREAWFFQCSLLHAVYGFFFGDTACSSESRALVHVLVNVRCISSSSSSVVVS